MHPLPPTGNADNAGKFPVVERKMPFSIPMAAGHALETHAQARRSVAKTAAAVVNSGERERLIVVFGVSQNTSLIISSAAAVSLDLHEDSVGEAKDLGFPPANHTCTSIKSSSNFNLSFMPK